MVEDEVDSEARTDRTSVMDNFSANLSGAWLPGMWLVISLDVSVRGFFG